MYFPRTAEYALRAMAHMARLPEGRALRAQELSEAADIPTPYLSKILRKLVLGGLLKSRKGHGGGFVLARPPRLIRFLDVLSATAFESNPADCAFGWGDCDPNHPCPLHPAWSGLRDQFLEWAASRTLADVQDDPSLAAGTQASVDGKTRRAGAKARVKEPARRARPKKPAAPAAGSGTRKGTGTATARRATR